MRNVNPLVGHVVSEMSALVVEDAADEGGVIHLSERLLVLAESLLQLVELAGGRDGAEEVLRAQGPAARAPASSYAFGGALPSGSWLWDGTKTGRARRVPCVGRGGAACRVAPRPRPPVRCCR